MKYIFILVLLFTGIFVYHKYSTINCEIYVNRCISGAELMEESGHSIGEINNYLGLCIEHAEIECY